MIINIADNKHEPLFLTPFLLKGVSGMWHTSASMAYRIIWTINDKQSVFFMIRKLNNIWSKINWSLSITLSSISGDIDIIVE